MALVSSYTSTANNLLGQTRSIKSSLQATRKSFTNINKVFATRTRIRSSIFKQRQVTNQRKLEALSRREQTDAMQAAKFSITSRGPGLRLAQTGKSFLGRILDFIASLSIGWILSNLPTWISYAKAFVKRVLALKDSIFGFVQAAFAFVGTFGNTLSGVLADIASFNFSQIPTTVDNGIKELEKSINDMSTEFEKGFSLFSQPLFDESELEQPAQQTAQEMSGVDVPPGAQGSGRTYYSEGGTKITDPGGKDYGTYIPGGRGSRGSARVHGADARTRGHTGEDYAMPIGTPLTMIAKGTVVDVETNVSRGGGYGKFVVIRLDSGEYVKLAHLNSVNVRKGDRVGAGSGPNGSAKVVGFSGDTGLSTGPHLHLDYASSYNMVTAAVSGTMDPMSFINGGGLVKGQNVKSSGQVVEERPSSQPTSTPQQTLVPGQPAPSGGTLSTAQLVALAKQVGMTKQVNVKGYSGPLDVLMGAVGMQESRGRSTAMRSDTEVYGLWQIRWPVHAANLRKIGITSPQQLYDPLLNAKAAKMIYESQGITAWSAFTDGKYKQFLPAAQKAAGISPSQYQQGQFTTMQQQNVPGSITPSREGEVIIAQFPSSGVSVPPGMQGYADSGSSSASPAPMPTKSESELLNTFIKNRLLVELSYL